MNARELQGRRDAAWGHTAGLIQQERGVKEGGRQEGGRRGKDDKSVSPAMRPSAECPGEHLSGCLVVLGGQDTADRPP